MVRGPWWNERPHHDRQLPLITDEHLVATGFWKEMDHPTEGRLRFPGVSVTFSQTPGDIRRHPPSLGEHSSEILRAAGYNDGKIAAMMASGATRTAT